MASTQSNEELVGRQHELSDLERMLADVRAGLPLAALVAGTTGIGKTTLVEHFLARQDGIHVEWSTGLRWERSNPFGVVTQLLGQRAADRPPQDPVDAAEQLLEHWSAGPTAVVVDDAHWADVDSLQALVSAHRRMTSQQVLILLIARTDLARQVPEEVVDLLGHLRPILQVGPLTTDDVRSLALVCSGLDLPAATARRLAEHTQGNPRYLRELFAETPKTHWDRWHPMLPVPESVRTAVSRTLQGCSATTRAFLEAAAVLGRTVSVAEAAEISGVRDPVPALDEACAAGLATTVSGSGLLLMSFPSTLIHSAVYHGLPPLVRHELHLKAAEAVQERGERLNHLVSVTPFPDSSLAGELESYADQQADLGAWAVAGQALINASRLSPDRSDQEHRLVRAVDAFAGAGDLPQASMYAPQIETLPPNPLRDAVLGYLAILRGRPSEAEALLTRAWEKCDPQRDPETAALICQRRVLHALSHWNGEQVVLWAKRAMQLADPVSPSAVESEAIIGLGMAASGRAEEARETYRIAGNRVNRGAQPQRMHLGKGWVELALDDPLSARQELEVAARTEYSLGSIRISLWAHGWLARTEFALGAWDAALQTVNRAMLRTEDSGMELMRPLVHWTGIQINALRGDFETAQEHLRKMPAATHSYEVMLIPACIARAQFAEAQSDYHGVLRALEPLTGLLAQEGPNEPGFWPWHDIYANALVMTSQVDAADDFLRPLEELAAERQHRSTQARLGYVRGRIHAANGDVDAARESFETALTRLKTLPLPYERARVNFAYGQTLRRAGKRKEADTVLHQAREIYAALGAHTYVKRCDRELKAGGMNAKRSRALLTELTPQEQSVAKLVAEGKTNKQVAVELFISVKTVQYHLTRIYTKLGLRSRSELAAQYHQLSDQGE
ncbi:helix-turn-helix transcriptional regulator [Saccharopolyspora rectivirgula]|uniref:LuxR family transcriptional regulator n=1 Tax=Saccharopolyspora rectivirgula TaxID=28042 RepID=A0A073B145_9PSEU|nr:LuxR family transcriptional regulator [Saccharopolyspora rectivirgula]KEI45713.1 LuxR family transcriptional regulator [Saccharopolyspora rectivirgula]